MAIDFVRIASFGFLSPIATIPSMDTVEGQIYTELESKLPDFGIEAVYSGRRAPRDAKSPHAAVIFEAKEERRNTNLATLSDYIFNVLVVTQHVQSKTGHVEKTRANDIAEQIRTYYNNKRDFTVNNLQLVKAETIDPDTEDRYTTGFSARMESAVQITFILWEQNRA